MIKKISVLLLCLLSTSVFAAPAKDFMHEMAKHGGCMQAPATTEGNFCIGFKASAYCHCIDSGMDGAVCEDMNQIYNDMIIYFSSVDNACDYQQGQDDGVPKQVCMDDWNCYRNGGTNSAVARVADQDRHAIN